LLVSFVDAKTEGATGHDHRSLYGRRHPKAMPVILTTTEEHDVSCAPPGARPRRRSAPFDGSLKIVATGEKEDPALAA
jgi:hypothetical protein